MPLKANSGVVSLADLLQIKGSSPGSCRVIVHAPSGPGVLAIENGRFVWAEYDGLTGDAAAYRILTLDDGLDFEMRTAIRIVSRNMDVGCQKLLVAVTRLKDEPAAQG